MKANSKEKYLHNTAGNRMETRIPTAKGTDTVESVIRKLRKERSRWKTTSYLYVISNEDNLVGVVSMKDLLAHKSTTQISRIMRTSLITVSPHTEVEKVADLAIKHNINAIPVVKEKKLLGVITTDKIFTILNRAIRDDVLHFAGIHKAHLSYENTLTVPLWRSMLHRLPWLLFGLAGIMLAASVIGFFESTLSKYIILAFFIPAVVYISNAVGIQHQSLLIRDLFLLGKNMNLVRYLKKELSITILLGLTIGILVFYFISFFWQERFIGFVIALSMFIAILTTSITEFFITIFIHKMGWDPAIGSGPFATIVSDFTSIVIYFIVAVSLLGF